VSSAEAASFKPKGLNDSQAINGAAGRSGRWRAARRLRQQLFLQQSDKLRARLGDDIDKLEWLE
jgi:hypothetical protein